ncbi:MAG TPA: S8 family serine peptidase [Chloroflexi bacterium]|nr:S8 family serine peptidase [Chloroflexota bacterium]
MFKKRLFGVFSLMIIISMLITPFAFAQGPVDGAYTDGPAVEGDATSHRLIVELASPSVAAWATASSRALDSAGKLDMNSAAAKTYVAQLEAEQAAFVSEMQVALPASKVSNFINEFGMAEANSYKVVMNGMAVDPGSMDVGQAARVLVQMDGVKRVYFDYLHTPDLYTSTTLINAPAAWNNAAVGGQNNAGAGVKVASVDGGLHKDAPMFDGTGYDYPAGFPANGLGLTANNNGKIIASRVYFREWDGPAAGDENPWPGENGTSHGVHTGSTAAGNMVSDVTYAGYDVGDMSGVAPSAWVMSYRVFYPSLDPAISGNAFSAELIAALDDAVADGADVINNSWGAGPQSAGGMGDPLDMALINATKAGTFVSMSNGNSGPGLATGDHPSPDYINVAASTTSGTLASGLLNVIEPEPITDTLQGMPYGTASFGDPLPIGVVVTHTYITAMSVDPANVTGCNPFAAGAFTGNAAVISRGGCFFSDKVYNAEQAGAEFAVIYNNAGDGLINMSAGSHEGEISIPSIFIGKTNGEGMVAWYAAHGSASVLELDTLAFQAGNTADEIINFSSRGPGVGNVLKPDIAAPGVNILAGGYTPGTSGEARHLGYGQASGTSMASPHVAGAAALLTQIHPDWSPAYIKSALMSTSKWQGIYNQDGTHAQPLDMGAGRLDLTNAADPGIILDPPSLSFGVVPTGTSKAIEVMVTSVGAAAETYDLAAVGVGPVGSGTFPLPWLQISPSSITLAPGESAMVTVTFDPAASDGIGDNQGFVTFTGSAYKGHMPGWARVIEATPVADVLVIDNDFSYLLGYPDYTGYYTNTLETLGYTYNVWDADAHFNNPATVPDAATLMGYRAIIYFTGDNYNSDGTFTVATPLTEQDQYRLTEFVNNGGTLIAMGQDMASVLGAAATDPSPSVNFYNFVLGANYLQDSVEPPAGLPKFPVIPTDAAPPAFQDLVIDLTGNGDSAANQEYVDEIDSTPMAEFYLDSPNPDLSFVPLFKYPGLNNVEQGVLSMAHRDQPTLERSQLSYFGRSVYTTFGLEGVSNGDGSFGTTTRAGLLQELLNWGWDNTSVSIADITPDGGTLQNPSLLTSFEATVTSIIYGGEISGTLPLPGDSGVSYRWDFGDGSDIVGPIGSNAVTHQYEKCGTYTVRVEAVDVYGNHSIGEYEAKVGANCTHYIYLPVVMKN